MAGQPAPGSPTLFTFDVTGLSINEPGLPPSVVIERTHPFSVLVNFEFAGPMAPFMVGLGMPCTVRVKYESLGEPPEGTFPTVTVTTVAGTLAYTGTINVPANFFAAAQEGPYQLTGTVVIPASPIAGHVAGPIVSIIGS